MGGGAPYIGDPVRYLGSKGRDLLDRELLREGELNRTFTIHAVSNTNSPWSTPRII